MDKSIKKTQSKDDEMINDLPDGARLAATDAAACARPRCCVRVQKSLQGIVMVVTLVLVRMVMMAMVGTLVVMMIRATLGKLIVLALIIFLQSNVAILFGKLFFATYYQNSHRVSVCF